MSTSPHRSLFIKDLMSSLPGLPPDVQISVIGVAVDVTNPDPETHPTRPLVVTLDDGTGVVSCVLFGHKELDHLRGVKIGDSFHARGVVMVSQYYQQTQLKCSALKVVTDPNFETLWINKVLLEKKNTDFSN
eukprot:GFUD01135359.1.p1 GENE.GFUD01135359.1~~GFUD01135359.1.p1  ORF type:complete len:140 (+),score=38.27 GFUD01135359.1:25-420(+)